jgi:BolA family transcriptional regulator, general stress-responsive regulator
LVGASGLCSIAGVEFANRLAEELRRALDADHVEVEDESELHLGHPGAAEGGHYSATVVAERFAGLDAVGRHRIVYGVLGDLGARGIHALALSTYTPDEWRTAVPSDAAERDR